MRKQYCPHCQTLHATDEECPDGQYVSYGGRKTLDAIASAEIALRNQGCQRFRVQDQPGGAFTMHGYV